MKILELNTKWGPKPLREIVLRIQNAINDRCPKPGVGIDVDENADGCVISTQSAQAGGGGSDDGSSGSGTSVAIYGARNGAPALFHLLQSSPPTAP